MTEKKVSSLTLDPWAQLQQYTDARIALGRCGSSLPVKESLKFKLAHARARDAVYQPVQTELLARSFESAGYLTFELSSMVASRGEYLTRPDLGRCLSAEAKETLAAQPEGFDLAVVICDGLSGSAVNESAVQFTCAFLNIIQQTSLTAAPVCLVKNGRVAIGDEIGSLLGARVSVLLVGERPGLSSPNSLGAYLTYSPAPGTTDEARNCISNIRPGGMTIIDAVRKTSYLVEMALEKKITGVELKDKMAEDYLPMGGFLLP